MTSWQRGVNGSVDRQRYQKTMDVGDTCLASQELRKSMDFFFEPGMSLRLFDNHIP